MEKQKLPNLETHSELNGISYTLQGDYYLPDLLPEPKCEPDSDAERINALAKSIALNWGADEALKASDQMKWVGLRNNALACAREFYRYDS